jgi:hypothetical protein
VRTYRKAVACVCLCVVLRLVAGAPNKPLPGLGDTGAPPRSLRHTSSPNADLLVSPVSSRTGAGRPSIEPVPYEHLGFGGVVSVQGNMSPPGVPCAPYLRRSVCVSAFRQSLSDVRLILKRGVFVSGFLRPVPHAHLS